MRCGTGKSKRFLLAALALALAWGGWTTLRRSFAADQEFAPTAATFTFRTMDHLKASVLLNGELVSETVCLWGYSSSYAFDPRIPVSEWPPQGAALIASAVGRNDEGARTSTVEMALAGGLYDLEGQARLKKDFPHLQPGEQVLYVKADVQGTVHQGALRLKVAAADGTVYRHTSFNPLQSEEDENAALFSRSLWFQRERSE